MSFLPRKGKYLYSGRLSTYKPQNIQVLVRIISCVQPLIYDYHISVRYIVEEYLSTFYRVWRVPLEYILGYQPEQAPEFFWNSSMPVSLHADSDQNLLENLGIIFYLLNILSN